MSTSKRVQVTIPIGIAARMPHQFAQSALEIASIERRAPIPADQLSVSADEERLYWQLRADVLCIPLRCISGSCICKRNHGHGPNSFPSFALQFGERGGLFLLTQSDASLDMVDWLRRFTKSIHKLIPHGVRDESD